MPKPTLLTRPGQTVPEWTLSTTELRGLMATAPARRPTGKLRIFPLPVPTKRLLVEPRLNWRDLLRPELLLCRIYCPPRIRVRKNQRNLTPLEWARFVHAIEALAESGVPSPTYAEFVDVHRQSMDTMPGMAWGAHAVNFLAWHREYLAKLEARLVTINPLVSIPYWNWAEDRAIPPQLSDPADLAAWGITRGGTFNSSLLATPQEVNDLLTIPDFATFQPTLQAAPFHNRVHNLVGGTMATSGSPADPIFWLHHAFIDKLWANWQQAHPGPASNPPNTSDTLQPAPIITRTVNQVLSTTSLGYAYQ